MHRVQLAAGTNPLSDDLFGPRRLVAIDSWPASNHGHSGIYEANRTAFDWLSSICRPSGSASCTRKSWPIRWAIPGPRKRASGDARWRVNVASRYWRPQLYERFITKQQHNRPPNIQFTFYPPSIGPEIYSPVAACADVCSSPPTDTTRLLFCFPSGVFLDGHVFLIKKSVLCPFEDEKPPVDVGSAARGVRGRPRKRGRAFGSSFLSLFLI